MINFLKACKAWLRSFSKTEWTLEDYPIRFREQNIPQKPGGRLIPIPWIAQIINWWQIGGHGDTKEEALENLKRSFENYRSTHEKLPRPGTGAPLEFASTAIIEQHEDLARDFLKRIFGYDYDGCIITDESSIYELIISDEEEEKCLAAIKEQYNIDASQIEGGRIADILVAINETRRN